MGVSRWHESEPERRRQQTNGEQNEIQAICNFQVTAQKSRRHRYENEGPQKSSDQVMRTPKCDRSHPRHQHIEHERGSRHLRRRNSEERQDGKVARCAAVPYGRVEHRYRKEQGGHQERGWPRPLHAALTRVAMRRSPPSSPRLHRQRGSSLRKPRAQTSLRAA